MHSALSRRSFTAALLTAVALAPMGSASAAAGVDHDDRDDPPLDAVDPELAARLDATIADVCAQAAIPGAVVGLWLPGTGSYVRASGVADTTTGEPMTTDIRTRIGSETKTFTATALLELVDDGRIGLDDPICAYVDGVPGGDRITLRHLAEMRSGLFPYTADPDFAQALLSDPSRSFTPEQSLAYGFKHCNTSAPGETFQYSNTNFVLLGLVIEKVSGVPLADFIRHRVLRPARLHRTLLPQGAGFPAPHPHGYTNQTLSGATADSTDWNPSWAWAAGAMISDLHDLRRWAGVVATGTLLRPQTQQQRLTTLPTGFPGTSYGLGILETGGWIGHNGSIPGYESVTVYLPARKATLVTLINTDITHQGQEPSTLLARAVTAVATPDNVYAGAIPIT